MLRSDKATSSQKKEAVKVLGAAVAAEAGKKVVESGVQQAKAAAKSKAGRAAIKRAAKKAAPAALAAARAVPVVGAIAATTYVGGKALTAQRKREATAFANRELRATKQRLPKGSLTAAQERTLWNQYYQHALKQAVQNPFVGK